MKTMVLGFLRFPSTRSVPVQRHCRNKDEIKKNEASKTLFVESFFLTDGAPGNEKQNIYNDMQPVQCIGPWVVDTTQNDSA